MHIQLRLTLACLASFVAVAIAAAPARAVPIRWTIQDAAFDDGGILTGSFVYDADTNIFSEIAITSTPGVAFGGASYVTTHRFAGALSLVALTQGMGDLTGTPGLSLFPRPGLTNGGGIVQLSLTTGGNLASREILCTRADCDFGSTARGLSAGYVIGSAVPEPGLLLLGVSASLGYARFRRPRAAEPVDVALA